MLRSSVIAHARLDVDPSATQKIQWLHLLRKSPNLAKVIGIKDGKQDLRKNLINSVLSD